jgi:two-component system chemotaxis response regulator CheB
MIIYFNDNDKKFIVENVLKHLKEGGYLFMGHSESLERISSQVTQVSPSIYIKSSGNNSKEESETKSNYNVVSERVVAIGSSMGGVPIIEEILYSLPQKTPPILIVQHMSKDILPRLISKLSLNCKIDIKEAQNAETLKSNTVYFAPYNKHLCIKKISKGVYKIELKDGERVANHKPSIDVLFNSLAAEAKTQAKVFLLTGMGNDGVEGVKSVKANGGKTYAQNEESSEVFGMAKAAINEGVIDRVLSPSEIVQYIIF